MDRAPRAVAPPPVAADSGAWAGTHGAVHGAEALVRITVQGRSPSDAVVLHALHVHLIDRAAALPWNAYQMDNGCGGAVTPRHFAEDLDLPRTLARPVDGLDASGAEVRKIPAVSFPYKVTSSDPEELLVSTWTADCDCRWYLELEWSAGGRTGTVRITDGGKPFRTSGTRGDGRTCTTPPKGAGSQTRPKCRVRAGQYCRDRVAGKVIMTRFHKPRHDAANAPSVLGPVGIYGLSWSRVRGQHAWRGDEIPQL
ncbi:hypothetical protein [Streptomyces sp. CB02115]|uniref:hypothetical protein n=1 Tax=Streptomyces sp. CB02115 TaxID=1703939 RepID=UPI000A566488|nr:hypothetical protein [Streptomyces sp. CB02115]